jgi:hypothetical protein
MKVKASTVAPRSEPNKDKRNAQFQEIAGTAMKSFGRYLDSVDPSRIVRLRVMFTGAGADIASQWIPSKLHDKSVVTIPKV